MSTVRMIFIGLAVINIIFSIISLIDSDGFKSVSADISAICGWLCAIIYAAN